MKAAVVTQPGTISIQEVPEPVPGPTEVVLAVSAVGICGTDLHIFDGHYAPTFPIIPGHEFSGTVTAVGTDVSSPRLGDKVAADPNVYCGHCVQCRNGRANQCENNQAIGVNVSGAMAEFVAVPAANCVVLPETLDLAAAALIEPLSCAVHAFDVLSPRFGQHVAIYGAGPMGLIMTSLAVRAGAASVSVVDLNGDRLSWASKSGATATFENPTELQRDPGFDIVIDCTGAVSAIEDGISKLAPGGTYLQFGVPMPEARVSISPEKLLMRELRLTGSRAVLASYERAAELFMLGAISPDILISDRFPLDRAAEAFEHFRGGHGRKIHIVMA